MVGKRGERARSRQGEPVGQRGGPALSDLLPRGRLHGGEAALQEIEDRRHGRGRGIERPGPGEVHGHLVGKAVEHPFRPRFRPLRIGVLVIHDARLSRRAAVQPVDPAAETRKGGRGDDERSSPPGRPAIPGAPPPGAVPGRRAVPRRRRSRGTGSGRGPAGRSGSPWRTRRRPSAPPPRRLPHPFPSAASFPRIRRMSCAISPISAGARETASSGSSGGSRRRRMRRKYRYGQRESSSREEALCVSGRDTGMPPAG